ncbi:TetR/AcrR family transcriptional regulator [Staphylococcus sp. SQ8-PEA]|uniref:TetR/AcrR family transcriptional regulator n=1 Tax=Staphylococcus marylandisciuri TaxID=2981529 RepID=A0ABT2QMP1_9STAP|nr:TetR/AcrR family transcriptional regulator [Staphylococcus marylandisciuri]MCU5745248.1 TetR/AcrR family transcriptional regulator [Staphylococcus marylandisciuri]
MKQKAKEKIIHHTVLLLEEYPFENITTKMICAYSGVNRSTFYDYFFDKYDLLHSIQSYHLDKYKKLLNALYGAVAETKTNKTCIFKFFNILLRYIRRNFKFFHAILIKFPNRSLFQEYIAVTRETYNLILENYSNSVVNKKYFVTYSLGGQMGIIYFWIRENCIEPPEQLAQILLANTLKLQH